MAEGASVTVVVVVEAEEALAGAEVGVAALGAEAEEEEEEDEVVSDTGSGGFAWPRGAGREEVMGSPSLTASLPCRWRFPVWWQPGSWSGRKKRKSVREECDGGASPA